MPNTTSHKEHIIPLYITKFMRWTINNLFVYRESNRQIYKFFSPISLKPINQSLQSQEIFMPNLLTAE